MSKSGLKARGCPGVGLGLNGVRKVWFDGDVGQGW